MDRFDDAVHNFKSEVRITGDAVWVGPVGLGSIVAPAISIPITTKPEEVSRQINRITDLLKRLPDSAREAAQATHEVLERLGAVSDEADARLASLGALVEELERHVHAGDDPPWHPRRLIGVFRVLENGGRRGDARIRVAVTTVHIL